MSLATVEYNDSVIYETDNSESFTIKTADTYVEDDIKVTVNGGGGLPEITPEDEGKFINVVDGAYALSDEFPSADNTKY